MNRSASPLDAHEVSLPADRNPIRIAVLGMHRSGTSYLAGSLQRAGLNLGAVSEWNEHNRAGNRESDEIVRLNDQVMLDNGGSWERPPTQVTWSAEQLSRAAGIASRHRGPWGFKDPRTLITLAGWLRAVPGLGFVGIFRHPYAVADSLQTRARFGGTQMSTEHCLAVWSRYNQELLARHDRDSFPLLSFDWEWDRLEDATETVCRQFGLTPPDPSDRFVARELRTRTPQPLPEPTGSVALTYRRLNQIAAAGHHA